MTEKGKYLVKCARDAVLALSCGASAFGAVAAAKNAWDLTVYGSAFDQFVAYSGLIFMGTGSVALGVVGGYLTATAVQNLRKYIKARRAAKIQAQQPAKSVAHDKPRQHTKGNLLALIRACVTRNLENKAVTKKPRSVGTRRVFRGGEQHR